MLDLPEVADVAITSGKIGEMIIVLPDSFTKYSGSMYSSSLTTGDWEAYVAEDLVAYVDSHYRTIADRLTRVRRSASNLQVGIAGFLAGAVFVALALLMPSLVLFIPMFLLGGASLYLYNGPYTAVKQNVVLPTVRATAVTVALLIEHLLGDSYAPWAIGKVSDALHDLRLALLILLPPLLLLAVLLAATGLRHEEPDGQAMEARWAEALTTP